MWFFLDCLNCSIKTLQAEWLWKNLNLFLTVVKLEIWDQDPGGWVRALLQVTGFSLYLYMLEGKQSSPKSLIWIWYSWNLICEGSAIMIYSSLKDSIFNTITCEFGGTKIFFNFQSLVVLLLFPWILIGFHLHTFNLFEFLSLWSSS